MLRAALLFGVLLHLACASRTGDVERDYAQRLDPDAGSGRNVSEERSHRVHGGQRSILQTPDQLSKGKLVPLGPEDIADERLYGSLLASNAMHRSITESKGRNGKGADIWAVGDQPAKAVILTEPNDANENLIESTNGRRLLQREQSSQPGAEAIQLRRQALQAQLAALDSGDESDRAVTLLRSNAMSRTVAAEAAADAARPVIQQATIPQVFVLTTIMASASGIGAVPFFFVGRLSVEWSALANAIACGVMLAASFDLVHEGEPYSAWYTIFGVLLGGMFIKLSQEKLEKWEGVRFEGLQGINAKRAVLLVTVMGAHALGEGSGVGVSFCGDRGWAQGVLVTLAIGLHNVPEGLAVATTLVARGVMPRQALLWSVLTSLPQAVVAVPAFMFVSTFRALLPLALGFAAGCMVWMVFAELLPDALENASHAKVATAATFSAAWLEALRMGFALLERPDGSLASPFARSFTDTMTVIALLLPAVLLASVAGGLIAIRLPSGSLRTGVAVGSMTASSLWQLNSSFWDNPLGLFWTIVCCAGGSAAALTALRQLASAADGANANGKKDDDLQVLEENGSAQNGNVSTSTVNGESWIPVASELITEFLPPQANSAAGERASRHDTLPSYMHPTIESATEPTAHRTLHQQITLPGQPRPTSYALVATLGAIALAIDGLPIGWRTASLLASDGGTSEALRFWLPLSIQSLLKGLSGASMAALVVGPSRRRIVGSALAIGAVLVMAATVQLSRTPVGVIAAESAASLALTAAKWQAASAGALLTLGVCCLMPAAQQMRGGSAVTGAACGALLALLLNSIQGALCLSTRFCLSPLI